MDELKNIEKIVTQPIITFDQYDLLMAQANQVADYIRQTELTEDNIQECKKKVAEARKSTNALNSRRIEVKKFIEEPYNGFKSQCDEIINVVSSAENELRSKINEYEEHQRELKKGELQAIWDKRAPMWECTQFVTFNNWLKPQHLNKTMSINKCEEDMVKFLAEKDSDIKLIKGGAYTDEVMVEYMKCLDIHVAVQIVDERKSAVERLRQNNDEVTFVIEIKSKSNFELAKRLLAENDIDFEIK